MRLRLTSWFKDLSGNLTGSWTVRVTDWHQRIRDFMTNHPRFGGGIVISVICIFLGSSWFLWSLTPVNGVAKTEIPVQIPFGATMRQVGKELEQKGLIHNAFPFEIYIRLRSSRTVLKAGLYRLNTGMSLPDIVKKLNRGSAEGTRVTIPEGLTLNEVAALLARKGLVNSDRFMALLKDRNFIGEHLSEEFPAGQWPEGYLFPDTYEFRVGATEEEIISSMFKRFEEVFQSHFPQVPAANRRRIVIIASLVEKEAKRAEERPIIAGVFYNRLQRDYPLQSCATVEYALGSHKTRLSYRDIQVNSPYNTYQHYGLPPGPIANPGLASLTAAVEPAKVSYLYFVAKNDGGHVFSETYEQHLRAQRRINH